MLTRYREYLQYLDQRLDKMFNAQKPFIKCQKGCGHCCKKGEFPISELEYINLMLAYEQMDDEVKEVVDERINNLIKNKREKLYECPFLVDEACSLYEARSIICRTFGLISYDKNNNKKMPFCVNLGLNYANVYDFETEKIIGNAEDGREPAAYNIDRRFLRSQKIEKEFDIFFGNDKPLLDWLIEDWGVKD